MTEPWAVWDCRVPSWWDGFRGERQDWLRDHGLPLNILYRAEFYGPADPFARIFCYHLDEDGRKHWSEDHLGGMPHDHSACAIVVQDPVDIALDALPPEHLRAVMTVG